MPSKVDSGWICNYAVLRYLVDPQKETTVPLGVVAPDELVSVTVTVQFEAWLTTTGVVQVTDVMVE